MATQQQISRALDDLFTTTWYNVRKGIVDQVFRATPFFDMMMEKGRIKSRVPDGTHFEIPIRYDKLDQNTVWFGRGANIGAQEKQSVTRLVYDVKNLASAVVRYWDDDRKNRGKARLENYLDEKTSNTRSALIDQLENDSFVQNASSLAMNALPTLVSSSPTSGIVGGLDRSQNSWMSNQVKNFTGLTVLTDLVDEMTTIFNNCSKWKAGTRKSPDIIITSQNTYEQYEAIARSLQNIVTQTSDRVSLGFGNLAFKGVELYWCPACPDGYMYFLNTEHLEIPYDPLVYFEMTEWKHIVGTSLDKVAQILTVCNMVADNFQKHGVIYNIPTA